MHPPLQWTVGDVTIMAVSEIDSLMSVEDFFPGATREQLARIDWFEPGYVGDDLQLRLRIQTFLVRTPGLRIVVDTGYGNDKQRPRSGHQLKTDLRDRLAAYGFAADDVDVVVCTHLHVDHVGWNTELRDGRWVPTFANARYLFMAQEYAHWVASTSAEDTAVIADSVQPVVDAGLAELVDAGAGVEHRVCDEVALVLTVGHTPGHVSVAVRSAGQEALISGDIVHHPAQLAYVDWACFVDCDVEQAAATRRRVLERLAASGALLIGTHFAPPTAGTVRVAGNGFALVPANHD